MAGRGSWWKVTEGGLALVAALLIWAGAACSRDPGAEPSPAATPPDVGKAVTKVVLKTTASVLIVPETEVEKDPLERVEVLPASIVADPGETVQLSARAYTVAGAEADDVDIVWTVVDPRAGLIDRQGRFQAGPRPGNFPGAVSVTAVRNAPEGIESVSATVDVTLVGEVKERVLSTVLILPEEPTVVTGQIYRLRAVALDQDGLVLSGADFLWRLNTPDLGELSPIGYLSVEGPEGTYPDAVTVTGVWEGQSLSATVDVEVVRTPRAEDFLRVEILPRTFYLEPGDQLRLRAVALNGLGELVTGTELRWSMAKPEAGVIDGSGRFVAGAVPGVYTEAVRVDAVAPGEQGVVHAVDFASVVIRERPGPRPLAALKVQPTSLTVPPGGRSVLSVQTLDAEGRPVQDAEIEWRVVDPDIGRVDPLGTFVAGTTPGIYPGALEVTVRQRGEKGAVVLQKTVDVTITGRLTSAELRPALAVVTPGRTVHFSVVATDQNGVPLPGVVVRWGLADESVGTIDAFGNFTAGEQVGRFDDVIVAEVIQTIDARGIGPSDGEDGGP